MNTRQEVLDAASAAVNGSRDADYGKPEDNFSRIARLWNGHLINIGLIQPSPQKDGYLEPSDVAVLLLLVKVARLAETPNHRDSWVDIAGYAACGAECAP